jgi:hypothetical protein
MKTFMQRLFGEVAQTERSAVRHPMVEAHRLGACPPAHALLAIADHAKRASPELRTLASERGATRSAVGTAAGSLFSIGRNAMADFFLTTEQSYRGTLLGIRHGYDVITLLRMAALAERDAPVLAWAEAWLAERLPLIESVAKEMRWFVDHPDRALRSAKLPVRANT